MIYKMTQQRITEEVVELMSSPLFFLADSGLSAAGRGSDVGFDDLEI